MAAQRLINNSINAQFVETTCANGYNIDCISFMKQHIHSIHEQCRAFVQRYITPMTFVEKNIHEVVVCASL